MFKVITFIFIHTFCSIFKTTIYILILLKLWIVNYRMANRHRVGSNEITNDIGTLVADIRTLVNAREDHADVTALRNRAADVITRIEDLQRRLMEAQPRGSMTIRCCEFHLSYLLVLRELVNHYEIASLLEEQIDALARGAKAA